MKKVTCIIFILALSILTACSAQSEPSELDKMVAQVEQAIPSEYEKQYETETYLFPFTNGEGDTLDYYICLTTYYAADPDSVIGLHTDAFRAVFDVDSTTLIKEFDASGHPAAIYQGNDRNYICCTTSPEASVVMAYDPNAVSEEDMIRSIRSIYENP